MKTLFVTLPLCAALAGTLAVVTSSPAAAAPTLPLPPPVAAVLEQAKLSAQPAGPVPIPLWRAELTTQLFSQPVGPAYPHWHWIFCVVTNSGLIDSGPFETWIGRAYAGTPMLPGPAIATEVPMDIPAGGQQGVVWPEYVSGPLQVGAYADWTHVVPEYNENNNSASLTVYP